MPTAEQFIARAEREVKVIEAMLQAREAMELANLAAVRPKDMKGRVEFSREIILLTQALQLMGHQSDS